ncbi:hypothetical protein EDC04DRAFT_2609176 [Pisolithus marmoratus]|nr:hypothetical protein EDC04DRAFT_2609176 [Pisolithus marmoratus]
MHSGHNSSTAQGGDNTGEAAHGTGHTTVHGGHRGRGRNNVSDMFSFFFAFDWTWGGFMHCRRVHPTSLAGMNGSAQCYKCHMTATPLWRKNDKGKTVCNGLNKRDDGHVFTVGLGVSQMWSLLQLQHANLMQIPIPLKHPIPMQVTVLALIIMMLECLDLDTLHVSELNGSSGLGGLGAGDGSPTLALDSTMQPAAYEFGEDGVINVGVHGVHSVSTAAMSVSELMGALGGDNVTSGYGSVSSLNMDGLGGMPINMTSMGLGMDREGVANGVTLGGIHVRSALGHAYGTFGHHVYLGPCHPHY